MSALKPLIETTGLVKKFGSFTALNGVSLKVYTCLLYTSDAADE